MFCLFVGVVVGFFLIVLVVFVGFFSLLCFCRCICVFILMFALLLWDLFRFSLVCFGFQMDVVI